MYKNIVPVAANPHTHNGYISTTLYVRTVGVHTERSAIAPRLTIPAAEHSRPAVPQFRRPHSSCHRARIPLLAPKVPAPPRSPRRWEQPPIAPAVPSLRPQPIAPAVRPPLAASPDRSLSSTSPPRSWRRCDCVGRRTTQRTPRGGCGKSSTPSWPPRRWQPDPAIEPPNRADPRYYTVLPSPFCLLCRPLLTAEGTRRTSRRCSSPRGAAGACSTCPGSATARGAATGALPRSCTPTPHVPRRPAQRPDAGPRSRRGQPGQMARWRQPWRDGVRGGRGLGAEST
jgi:hypothetical protein